MAMQFTASSSQYFTPMSSINTWLNTTATLTYWINTTQVGSDTTWNAPGVCGWEQVAAQNDIFWGIISADGYTGGSVGDVVVWSTTAINDGSWHHVACERNSSTGGWEIFVDGYSENTGTLLSGDIAYSWNSIGMIGDSGATPIYLDGKLSDVRIYDRLVTAKEIEIIYTDRSGDNIYDGLISRWNLDEKEPGATASGSGTVIDMATTGNHGTSVNSPQYAESVVFPRRRRKRSI